jgi:hypothetical protein
MERWAEIQGHPGHYISDHGRVKGPRGIRTLYLQGNGYYYVGIWRSGKLATYRVHRLVALHFCPNDNPINTVVAHRDNNKTNNKWDNLRWSTQRDNMLDRELHGTAHKMPKGEGHHASKTNPSQVLEIREKAAQGQTVGSLAKEYGLAYYTVRCIVKRSSWKHI